MRGHVLRLCPSGTSHSNPTLPYPILISGLVWSSSPHYSRSPKLYSKHWWVYMLAICLCPSFFMFICLFKHIHRIPIRNIVNRFCTIFPYSTYCMCTWESCHVPLSTPACSSNQVHHILFFLVCHFKEPIPSIHAIAMTSIS
jgi:hypothetical protein